jgi:hypothetical protein
MSSKGTGNLKYAQYWRCFRMNSKEPKVMRMLRKIREEIHEDTKDLSDEEWVKRIKKEAEACKKEYGIKLPMRVKVTK